MRAQTFSEYLKQEPFSPDQKIYVVFDADDFGKAHKKVKGTVLGAKYGLKILGKAGQDYMH